MNFHLSSLIHGIIIVSSFGKKSLVSSFGKKSCGSTGVRKPGNTGASLAAISYDLSCKNGVELQYKHNDGSMKFI